MIDLFNYSSPEEIREAFASNTRIVEAKYDMSYIAKNLDKLEDYELRNIEHKIKYRDIRDRLDIHVSENDGAVDGTNLKVDLSDPIDKIIAQIQANIGADFQDIDFELWKELGYLVKYDRLTHTKGKSFSISLSSYADDIITFLIYITEGKVEKDRGRGIKIAEELGLKGYNIFEFEFNGVKVKKFKNGRLDLSFPKKSQLDLAINTVNEWWKAWEIERKRR